MYGYNSTILRKKKVCKICGKESYIFSKGRCQPCSTIEDTQKRMDGISTKIISEEGLSNLVQSADEIFSKYIRLKYADKHGVVKCYTCDYKVHWTLMQNGHYIKRGHLFLRWDERNCRPQDNTCNQLKHGNIREYTRKLEEENPGITEILLEESYLIHKPTREEIRAIITEYTKKVKILKESIIPL